MRAAAVVALALLAVGSCAVLRPNGARVEPALRVEHWPVVSDGAHNSNTDLIAWRDGLLLVHATSPWHLGSTESRLLVKFSADGREWETLARLGVPGRDVRDPKLVVRNGRLHVFALPNEGLMATPTHTVLATSDDGRAWSGFEPVGPEGWLLWRPKTRDGRTWYAPAYWHEHGESALLRSKDLRTWTRVSRIHKGDANDETAIEFLPDGRLLATARLEGSADSAFGHQEAGTLLAVARPPFTEWESVKSYVDRLDGPALFSHAGRVYAVARHQEGRRRSPTGLGSFFSRKRTAIYEVGPDRLLRLSDLPSAGDTSYAGWCSGTGTST